MHTDVCVQAQDVDDEKKHRREIEDQMQKVTMAMYTQRAGESEEETLQRAMRDPEIAGIMGDPVMQQVRKTRILCVQLIHVLFADFATGATGAWGIARSYEESDHTKQDSKADCGGDHQDAVRGTRL